MLVVRTACAFNFRMNQSAVEPHFTAAIITCKQRYLLLPRCI